jgi:hypothetical protein
MLIIRDLSQAVRKLVSDFRTLQRIQFDAPWNKSYRGSC